MVVVAVMMRETAHGGGLVAENREESESGIRPAFLQTFFEFVQQFLQFRDQRVAASLIGHVSQRRGGCLYFDLPTDALAGFLKLSSP